MSEHGYDFYGLKPFKYFVYNFDQLRINKDGFDNVDDAVENAGKHLPPKDEIEFEDQLRKKNTLILKSMLKKKYLEKKAELAEAAADE